MIQDLVEKTLGAFAFVGAIAAMAVVVITVIMMFWPHPTFSLRRAEWACTATHRERHTSGMMVGKVWVPQSSVVTVCDQWTRVGA